MKITRDQLNKINSKMGNGWELDLWYLMVHGDKTATIKIPMEDGGHVQGKLYINKVSDWRPGAYNGVQIRLNVSRWYKGSTDGVYTSSGLGYWEEYNRPEMSKAMFSEVQKMTHTITAADIMQLYSAHSEQCASARIM